MPKLTEFSKVQPLKKVVLGGALLFAIGGTVVTTTGCFGGSSQEYTVQEKVELTKGLITTLEEVSPNRFLIEDEKVVENKADSRIIAKNMDGTIDTFTLDQASMVELPPERRQAISSPLMGGLMGYYLGRSMSVAPSPGVYKNNATYNRINSTAGTTLSQTAKRTTTSRPRNSSSGYGGSRSGRSYSG